MDASLASEFTAQGESELIVLGSGSSTGVPSPVCLLRPSEPPCLVCHAAMEGQPELNKNYRCNPSLLINYLHQDGHRRFIQIDAGKNFKEQVLRWFVRYKIPRLDAVMHGEDYVSLGFLFGKGSRIAYISDVSRIPPSTEWEISADGAGPLDFLFLDCLYKKGPHNTHFCWDESLATVKRLRPKRAFFVGMTHEFHHERENAELADWSQREGIQVQLAYDGMRIPVKI